MRSELVKTGNYQAAISHSNKAAAIPMPPQRLMPARFRRDNSSNGSPLARARIITGHSIVPANTALPTAAHTSMLRPAGLRSHVRELLSAPPDRLTLVFESFAFKYGVPLDADYVFDVRVLPNPYYLRDLRALSGRDDPVANFLLQQPEAVEMLGQIEGFLRRWLPALSDDQRAYVTVAIGCTGGQHRSVFMAEQLGRRFSDHGATLVRHRELDAVD